MSASTFLEKFHLTSFKSFLYVVNFAFCADLSNSNENEEEPMEVSASPEKRSPTKKKSEDSEKKESKPKKEKSESKSKTGKHYVKKDKFFVTADDPKVKGESLVSGSYILNMN